MGASLRCCKSHQDEQLFNDTPVRVPQNHYSRNSITGSFQNSTEQVEIRSEQGSVDQYSKVSLNDFTILQTIGKGSFGTVLLVEKKPTNNLYAMKIIEKERIDSSRQKIYVENERIILQTTDHPFAIKLHYAFQTRHKLYLVMEFQQGGDLSYHIRQARRFEENVVQFIAAELVLVLDHLHKKNIIYRDLKPANVVIGEDGHIKIADFGLSKINIKKGEMTHSIVGTVEYLAPEIYMEGGYSHMCDWWSLGALIYEMLTGTPPFYSQDKKQMFRNKVEKQLQIKSWFSEGAEDIVNGLIQIDPRERLGFNGIQEIKSCKFFKNIDWDALYKKKLKSPLSIELDGPLDVKYFNKILKESDLEDQHILDADTPEIFKGFSYQIDDHFQVVDKSK